MLNLKTMKNKSVNCKLCKLCVQISFSLYYMCVMEIINHLLEDYSIMKKKSFKNLNLFYFVPIIYDVYQSSTRKIKLSSQNDKT